MQLEIVSPEKVLMKGTVHSVTLPGKEGKFEMLDNHAPIVSVLVEGSVFFKSEEKLANQYSDNFLEGNDTTYQLNITGGVVEMKNNKAIVLVD